MNISLIVAVDQKFGIGKDGDLPWHLPEDLKHFKEVTTSVKDSSKENVVIMGRKTWDSLPEKFRPLPNRINMVITRDPSRHFANKVSSYRSLDEAVLSAKELAYIGQVEKVFIIGGGEIFKLALQYPQCEELLLTHINQNFKCDTFFPDFSFKFKQISKSDVKCSEGGLSYYFAVYQKKS